MLSSWQSNKEVWRWVRMPSLSLRYWQLMTERMMMIVPSCLICGLVLSWIVDWILPFTLSVNWSRYESGGSSCRSSTFLEGNEVFLLFGKIMSFYSRTTEQNGWR
mmetsp:Transcript_13394/g.32706  ORF Transcript_13394/g.32706 Transcript_13394/m.32706 type:complete len:105 (+) Transcript_13394:90-404(+)